MSQHGSPWSKPPALAGNDMSAPRVKSWACTPSELRRRSRNCRESSVLNPATWLRRPNSNWCRSRVGHQHQPKEGSHVGFVADRSHPEVVRRHGRRECFQIAPGGRRRVGYCRRIPQRGRLSRPRHDVQWFLPILGRLRRVLRERGRVLRVGRARDRSRTLFRRYEERAEGAIPIRPFLDNPRRQDRAPAADRRHPSYRASSGKMTGAPRMERVQLNGADIEYDVRGSGAPVVFIHGAILSDGFVPVIELTGIAENFQIVHYRRRGYAGSLRALAGMTMQEWAGDCIALLNHLGIASAHVAGHSFGAGIALQMAIDAPGRVRKLALLEPPLLSLVPSGAQFTEWVASVREIYDSGDKTAATDTVLAGAYGQDYRRFTDR